MTVGTIMTFSLYFSTLWNSVEGFMDFFKEYRVKQVSLARLDDMHSMCPEEAAPQGEALRHSKSSRATTSPLPMRISRCLRISRWKLGKGSAF